ncbi:angiotensin-converting enzyme-like isoform X2 [Biomphalaria glabrata]|uniref:Angiotensin-converting enzyme n=1 Tax=Biomphalaria glabrata TaxID=6526 RepID=A0A9W2Z1Q0_BIOGL|nr:angiotensin-converting enzyme-like isoform X2 [Biomphalaria glabrata]
MNFRIWEIRRLSAWRLFLCVVILTRGNTATSLASDVEELLHSYNTTAVEIANHIAEAEWSASTNLSSQDYKDLLEIYVAEANFRRKMSKEATKFDDRVDTTEKEKRELLLIAKLGEEGLTDPELFQKLKLLETEWKATYTNAVECHTHGECPNLGNNSASLSESRKLLNQWAAWRDDVSPKIQAKFHDYVQLMNTAYQSAGYTDAGQGWRSNFETDTLKEEIHSIYTQVLPLYEQLHGFVGSRLKTFYGSENFPRTGHIPAHLLGKPWEQDWRSIYDKLIKSTSNKMSQITANMIKRNFTYETMFRLAEEFYSSMGLDNMTSAFWTKSLLTKPNNDNISCEATAWDFYTGSDYRIKMCTEVTLNDLLKAYQLMGTVEHFMYYQHLEFPVRRGAYPAFEEVLGGLISLSARSSDYLRNISLLDSRESEDTEIQFLLNTALEFLASIPHDYLVDLWRWSVFDGYISSSNYNNDWWQLRCRLQGISSPVSETYISSRFDPATDYNVAGNKPGSGHLINAVIIFQLHKSLCESSGHKGPLHRCNLYGRKDAGTKLKSMMQLGSLKPWQALLLNTTGDSRLSPSALLEYFQPLIDFLQTEIGNDFGWDSMCPQQDDLSESSEYATEVESVKQFLDSYEMDSLKILQEVTVADWNEETNITDYNKEILVNIGLMEAKFSQVKADEAERFNTSHLPKSLARQLKDIKDLGELAQRNETKYKKLQNIKADMESIYGTAKVCLTDSECLELTPGLDNLMATSKDYDRLLAAWVGWQDASGRKMKYLYPEYVQLLNEAYRLAGYSDAGEGWRSDYESPSFEEDVAELLSQLQPLYEQLHGYVRRHLMLQFGQDKFPSSGHIPAHLLGNMWAQNWEALRDRLLPFPDKIAPDITSELINNNYTTLGMFRTAEDFFVSLGLKPMTKYFWNKSELVRPADGRGFVCHGSAFDMKSRNDFRIKMCSVVNKDSFITAHHEMGHIQYYMQYEYQPVSFRNGANGAFHEAIGDVMALSVQTPKHLHKIGLLRNNSQDYESDINSLMEVALRKVAFFPFGYLVDNWRWSVFRGDTKPNDYNKHWWDLRCRHQGLSPPVPRLDSDFDPGAKYHVAASEDYIRYFISNILQFQIYKGACEAAGHIGPLHTCDIYGNKAAGDRLRKMLHLGSSRPWPEALKIMTGQEKIDTGPLMEYFHPLYQYLKKQNGKDYGWDPKCPQFDEDEDLDKGKDFNQSEVEVAQEFLNAFNSQSVSYKHLSAVASWNLKTNLTTYNQQVYMLTLKSDLEKLYSTATVCLNHGKCLPLDPDITHIMAQSRNYQELLDVWSGWREATGVQMKEMYAKYVDFNNEALRLKGIENAKEDWLSVYESETFEEDVATLFAELLPLYEQLHAYVRRHLKAKYGQDKFPSSGQIPAHILGNMWGQNWENILSEVIPFPKKESANITAAMLKQNYTVEKMLKLSESFYASLGFQNMTDLFWNKSEFVKPKDGRNFTCHASAHNMHAPEDFRIKMCAEVTKDFLYTIHHEMGHVQYYMEYDHQPIIYKAGANDGFHEAIGDLMSLSVQTPEHLQKIKILDHISNDTESDINFLMAMALNRVAFLPFGYLVDKWRWSVFTGDTTPAQYNKHWWDLRCRYQGLSPPIKRQLRHFDPGAKYHVASNTPYMRYFVSFIIQFQFHKAACDISGYEGPLHRCDIYGSKPAGDKIRKMLSMGASRPWPLAMKVLTGQKKMDATPLLNYFQPLMDYLQKENGNDYGWDPHCSGAQYE